MAMESMTEAELGRLLALLPSSGRVRREAGNVVKVLIGNEIEMVADPKSYFVVRWDAGGGWTNWTFSGDKSQGEREKAIVSTFWGYVRDHERRDEVNSLMACVADCERSLERFRRCQAEQAN